MDMIIKNGLIYMETGEFAPRDLLIEEGRIKKITHHCSDEKRDMVLDARDWYVLPGFVDIHLHGCMGYDFSDQTEKALEKMEEYELSNGITTFFAATMTLPEERLRSVLENAKAYIKKGKGVFRGVTMEGPFISDKRKGAQDKAYIRNPEILWYQKMQKLSGGLICQVSVAPELKGGYEFIREISKETVVSLAHTDADYECAKKAFAAGSTHVTHLFNGMNPLLHREPGLVGAALEDSHVFVELICDGVHIHPAVVRLAFKMCGADRVCMISDSIPGAGMPDGTYRLGGRELQVKDNVAKMTDGTIAGSVCNLYRCFQKAVLEMKIPLEQAVCSCTQTPARSLGVEMECGSLKEGRDADILIIDKQLNIRYVLKKGNPMAL